MYLSLSNIPTIALYTIALFSLVVIAHKSDQISSYITQSKSLNKLINFFKPRMLHRKIWAISLDYDGTFDNGHQEILEWINQFKDNFSRVILMVGSIRQSRLTDELNQKHNNNGSIRAIEYFAYDHNFQFDPFLMGDIYSDRTPGETYLIWSSFDQVALEAGSSSLQDETLKFIYDKKMPIVHAQTHYLQEIFPNKEILYTLIDDREDIGEFLDNHVQPCLPPKVKFNFVNFTEVGTCEPSPSIIQSKSSFFNCNWRIQHIHKTAPCYPKNITISQLST